MKIRQYRVFGSVSLADLLNWKNILLLFINLIILYVSFECLKLVMLRVIVSNQFSYATYIFVQIVKIMMSLMIVCNFWRSVRDPFIKQKHLLTNSSIMLAIVMLICLNQKTINDWVLSSNNINISESKEYNLVFYKKGCVLCNEGVKTISQDIYYNKYGYKSRPLYFININDPKGQKIAANYGIEKSNTMIAVNEKPSNYHKLIYSEKQSGKVLLTDDFKTEISQQKNKAMAL